MLRGGGGGEAAGSARDGYAAKYALAVVARTVEVPIAQALPSLAEDVAGELARGAWREGCTFGNPPRGGKYRDDPPPFAAAYHDAGGVRVYVLASAACGGCDGYGLEPGPVGDNVSTFGQRCPDCNGTGARTDVSKIAARYGGTGTARLARFEVSL